jgi:hypothetical protein
VQVLADEPLRAGKQLGRPKIDPTLEKRNPESITAGKGMLAIAKALGVGASTTKFDFNVWGCSAPPR